MTGPSADSYPRRVDPSHPGWDGPGDELFDWVKVRRYALFALRSVRRRPGLFASIALGMIAAAAGALAVMPKTYEVESRLLAQKNPVLAVRADNQLEQPARSAAELILRRENLHALIRQTDLLAEWPKRRAPILRLKDRLMLRLRGPSSENELLDALTGFLERRLMVWTTPDGTVTIRVQWPDPQMAYRLVDAAEQNFLEKRHVLEVSTIAEQISILEVHAADLQKEVDQKVGQLEELRQRTAPKGASSLPRPAPHRQPSADLVRLRVLLDAKRRAIADLESFRQRHLTEVSTRLSEQRAVYSENHPIVVNLRQTIESLQRDSPQLAALRQDEADLRRQIAARRDEESPAAAEVPAEMFRSDPYGTEDSSVEYARAQLRFAVQQHTAMLERIAAARVDLDTARAAFKYRYSVVVPPEVPRGPIKPKPTLVMLASVVAGLLLALFATTAADLRSGVFLELWQLEDVVKPGQAIVEVPFP